MNNDRNQKEYTISLRIIISAIIKTAVGASLSGDKEFRDMKNVCACLREEKLFANC